MGSQDDRSTIETRSGTWEWTLKSFSPWPKSSPVSRRLGFKDPDNGVNTMSVRLEPEVEDQLSEKSVRRLSLDPLSRRFADSAGRVWIAHPVSERRTGVGDAVRQVSLHSLECPSEVKDLPPGRTLGDLKNKELANLVQS